MKKVFIILIVIGFVLAISGTAVMAAGGKVRGEKAQGPANQHFVGAEHSW